MSDQQADFFSIVQSPGPELADFAELCNALYERELLSLAHSGPNQLNLLKRKLAGLSHHIKNVAYYLCRHQAPLEVDTHNASFQHKQAAKSPGRLLDKDKNTAWFSAHAAPGLVVPINVVGLDSNHIELDSVDRIDMEQGAIHTNKHGWFEFSGVATKQNESIIEKQLLKPSKAIMQAACCGHRWNHKSRKTPRSLTLRELLLCAQIDWKRFTLKH
jgi:hypothetical protein